MLGFYEEYVGKIDEKFSFFFDLLGNIIWGS